MLAAIPLGLAIGLVIGSVGGGGAILAMPVLVYVLGEPVAAAATGSLVVVFVAAGVAATASGSAREACWQVAVVFATATALGALAGTLASRALEGAIVLLAFVPVLLVAAVAMWRRGGAERGAALGPCPRPISTRLIASAVAVGVLIGFFGIGGGFIIVPVLSAWLGVGTRRAVATSLVIIALSAFGTLVLRLALESVPVDAAATALLAVATGLGALAGASARSRLSVSVLSRGFALVVVLVAVLLVVDVAVRGGPS